MKLVVIWSEFAENQLGQILDHYKEQAGLRVAKNLIKEIIEKPNILIKSPYIGQVEYLLKERKIQYRYLIFKSYKLIYSVDEENGFIRITDVFDTRQYPSKILRTK